MPTPAVEMTGDAESVVDMMRLGLPVRPELTHVDVAEMLHRLYGLRDVEIMDLNAYDDRNYHVKAKGDQQFSWPHGYVLKVINALDSRNFPFIEAQTELLVYLGSHGFTCPQPVRNAKGNYFSTEELPKKRVSSETSGTKHVVRLLTYQPGRILSEVPVSTELMYQLGDFAARLDGCLQGFYHPVFEKHESIWSLHSAPKVKQFAYVVEDPEKRLLVDQVLDDFDRNVMSQYATMEKGLVHGDLNEQNLVCRECPAGVWSVCAVLDLGDCHVTSLLFELAVCLCYVTLLPCPEPLEPVDVAGHVLAGYCALRPLEAPHKSLLKTCICARLCQSLVLGAYSHAQFPDNDYLLTTAKKGWALLKDLWGTPPALLERRWADIAAGYHDRA